MPRRLARLGVDTGLIGSADRLQVGWTADAKPIEPVAADDVPDLLVKRLARRRGTRMVVLGGTEPHSWELSVVVGEFLPRMQMVRGVSMMRLTFDPALVEGEAGSARLIDMFLQAHRPADTEYAAIHPEHRWSTLRGTDYENAVVVGHLFAGVHWANFLGPGHLDLFDRAKLTDLPAHLVRWVGDDGLFVVVTPSVDDAEDPETESRMFALTATFRRALRER